jgi:hypothetical protein
MPQVQLEATIPAPGQATTKAKANFSGPADCFEAIVIQRVTVEGKNHLEDDARLLKQEDCFIMCAIAIR